MNTNKQEHLKQLDITIATLIATRDSLAKELNQAKSTKDQLIDSGNAIGTWVILSEKNMYYQFIGFGINKTVCHLSRGKKTFVVLASDLNNKYRIAKPEEAYQHETFLRAKATLEKFSATSISADKLETYHVKHDKPVSSFDPMKCDFYMVTCRGLHGAKVRHTSYGVAESEAMKIAKAENHETWIVGVVASVKPSIEVSVTVNKR